MATANELGQAGTTAWLMSALGLAPAPIARPLNRFVQFNSGMFNLGRGHDPEPHPPAHSQGRVDKRTAREVTPTPARTRPACWRCAWSGGLARACTPMDATLGRRAVEVSGTGEPASFHACRTAAGSRPVAPTRRPLSRAQDRAALRLVRLRRARCSAPSARFAAAGRWCGWRRRTSPGSWRR
jgi:hypothetical protein